ncbi:RagB/SusD family nutrient uptake outer membrane protein [Chitinophaga cymbidii]|uniref:Membrane protein n=1 Tax=Chitinophaga cymbidii TaxID=1096750 RepID=A0A512RE01_9BACT|nr:RagB/SusD family nutrient uptake outer membrane protein [Chitinophaga cymbidii]GEP93923.1 membrane protein [Chitinophaga cymbidii]
MKNIFNIGLLSLILLATSCKKDALQTTPTSSVGTATLFETTKSASLAINGLAKMMTMQYLSSQGFNGEGTIKMLYGNYPGNHFFVNLSGWAVIINSEYHENVSSIYLYYPWYYYYKLIGNANIVLAYIDDAAGPDSEKEFIKAQALTYRAYSFMMLAQLYGFRWQDTNNGASEGLALRTDLSTGEIPLSTMAETYKLIYDDLDQAIAFYTSSGKTRSINSEPDINVAYAVYARAALNRQDYPTAETYAVKAREGYPLMSAAEYKAGFANPNSEWIWSSHGGSDETLYYYSYQAYIAYNSNASAVRTTPKCISRELYNKIPATDIRRDLFLDPTGYTYTTATGAASPELKARAFELYPDIFETSNVFAYMQFKVKANDLPGVGHTNHFRSSEMYLIEAEAKYFQNKPASEVQQVLEALTAGSGRDASYTCTKTGADLLNEIKTYRAIELWGEGFDWFDMKRWNDPIVRNTYANGGNFLTSLAKTIQPSQFNKWTWKVPLKETDYNDAIKQ